MALISEAESSAHKRRLFAIGLGVRLLGLLFLWLGDGHPSVFRKSLVVLGLVLSIGGIAVLRFLLLARPLARLGARLRKRRKAARSGP
ncbi:MAG: hypothetical protein ABJD11_14090 [Gemmatimonadota bacterium]